MHEKDDSTNIALILQKMEFMSKEIAEIKTNMTDGYVTMVQYKVEIGGLKKLVYWMLGLLGSILVAMIAVFIGLVL